jgi:hypothetical protein
MTEKDIANYLIKLSSSRIKYGLFPGSGDYIGWTTIKITPDMIDYDIAVFTSSEIKTEHDNLTKKQRAWNKAVRIAGGISEVLKEKNGEIHIMKGEEIE